ncbi:MAG: T9SS type A sorting domain-containing protein, partial [Thiohalospira sp.]
TDGSIDITVTGGTVATDYIYSWSTADGSGLVADAEDQTGLSAGTYDLTVTDDNGCEEAASIVIIEPEAITIVSDTAINTTSESATDGSIEVEATGGTGILTYLLTPGDISNETGIFNNLGPDDYTVSITDENGCGPVTTSLTVSFPDAIQSISNAKSIKLYPNPTSAKITLEIDADRHATYTIEILNIAGQRLYKENTETNGNLRKEIDLSEYAKGIYFIKVITEGFYYQEKVIFQ